MRQSAIAIVIEVTCRTSSTFSSIGAGPTAGVAGFSIRAKVETGLCEESVKKTIDRWSIAW